MWLVSQQPAHAAAATGVGGDTLVAFTLGLAAFAILLFLVLRNRSQPLSDAFTRGRGRRRIRRIANRAQLELLTDFILPGACDGLARIDGAILTPCGIVCLRAMHGNGMVFGDAGDPQWQNRGRHTPAAVPEPVIQNDGRVNADSAG
ncbi:MAG: nuclease-related domain-containing protein [Woeseiaceae bacterium]|nr:nuclease-related domain-containing protein [Woeseiaceae bacterium]